MPFLLPFALPLLVFGAIASMQYLRTKPLFDAPKPEPKGEPYTPPFLGGQCVNVNYRIFYRIEVQDGAGNWSVVSAPNASQNVVGAFQGMGVEKLVCSGLDCIYSIFYLDKNGKSIFGSTGFVRDARVTILSVTRPDGLPDNCGNLPNPNPVPSIKEDGLFTPTNEPPSEAAIVVAPALPIALVAAIFTAAKAALDAAAAATATLDAVKKIAEALLEWNKLFEKLSEFLDDWERNRSEKRRISRQTYGIIKGDGAIDFYFNGNEDYIAIQLDVVITDIPIGYGKYFAENSPYRYPYKKLGYIAFYSNTLGIISVHDLEWRRTALEVPKNAVGFIYHLGLDEQIEGYAFGSFSVKQ